MLRVPEVDSGLIDKLDLDGPLNGISDQMHLYQFAREVAALAMEWAL